MHTDSYGYHRLLVSESNAKYLCIASRMRKSPGAGRHFVMMDSGARNRTGRRIRFRQGCARMLGMKMRLEEAAAATHPSVIAN